MQYIFNLMILFNNKYISQETPKAKPECRAGQAWTEQGLSPFSGYANAIYGRLTETLLHFYQTKLNPSDVVRERDGSYASECCSVLSLLGVCSDSVLQFYQI